MMPHSFAVVVYTYMFVLAACIGSFLNVVAYRLPNKLSFVKGRSFCPACEHRLGVLDLIPIVSYLLLGGRCRYCRAKISPRYLIVEVLSGLAGMLCVYAFSLSWAALSAFAVYAILLCIALIDIDTMMIPDSLNLILIIPALAAVFLFPEVTLPARLIGIVVVALPMLLLCLVVTDAFGGGDIKLMAVAGFLLGWQQTLLAFFIALLIGGAYGVILLARKRRGHIAFGPYLCLGIFLALTLGDRLIGLYLGLFGL